MLLIFKKIIKSNYWLPLFSGIISAPPMFINRIGLVILVSLIPFFLFLYKENELRRILLGSVIFGFFFSFVFTIVGYVDFSLIIIFSLWYGLFGLVMGLVRKKIPEKYFWFILPVIFSFFNFYEAKIDFITTHIFKIGNALGSTQLLPLSKLAGLFGLTLFISAVNLSFVWLYINKQKKYKFFIYFSLFSLFIIGLTFFINVKVNNDFISKQEYAKFAIVSFSVDDKNMVEYYDLLNDSKNKYVETYLYENFYINLKQQLVGKVDYIFFPNQVLDIDRNDDINYDAKNNFGITNNGAIINFFSWLANDLDANVVVGISTIESDNKMYNSALAFNKKGELVDVYHKHDLVIGSEYWPFGDWVPFWWYWQVDTNLNDKLYIGQTFSKSKDPYRPLILDNVSIGNLICSEAQNQEAIRTVIKRGANFGYASVNSDWYSGASLSAYYQMYLNNLRINSYYNNFSILLNGKNNIYGEIYPNGDYNIMPRVEPGKLSVWQGDVKY